MKRIAFFDWDGTLSMNGVTVSDATRTAISAFREKGNLAFLCTGRSLAFVPKTALAIGFDGVIAGSGATIVLAEKGQTVRRDKNGNFTGNWLFRQQLSDDLICLLLETYSHYPQTICKLEGERYLYWLKSETPFHKYLEDGRDVVLNTPADYWDAATPKDAVSKATVYCEDSRFPKVDFGDKLSVITHPRRYQEIGLPYCTKSDGIRRVIQALSLPWESTVAFGDSPNDLDMLEYVACGVAVENAPPLVKEKAHRVTVSCEQDGVAAILNEMI